MDHASRENIFDELNNFEKKKPAEVPTILEEYLELIAKTGDILFSWSKLKPLFKHKLDKVIVKFNEDYPAKELPFSPNMEKFNYEEMHSKLLNAVDEFSGAPFTIQRLCELIVSPDMHYKRIDKFMRALEKDLLVVSTIEPLCKRQKLDSDNIPLMNGVMVDGNSSHNGSAQSPPRSGEVDVQSLDESTADAILNSGEGSSEPGEAISKQAVATNGTEPVRLENGQAEAAAAVAVEQMETMVSSSSSVLPASQETNGHGEEIKVNGEATKAEETSKPTSEIAEPVSQEPSTTQINVNVDADQPMDDVSSDQPMSTLADLPEPSALDNIQSPDAEKLPPVAEAEAAVAVSEVAEAAATVSEVAEAAAAVSEVAEVASAVSEASASKEQPQSTVAEQKVPDTQQVPAANAESKEVEVKVDQPAPSCLPDDATPKPSAAVASPEPPQSTSSVCDEPESSAEPEPKEKVSETSSANESEQPPATSSAQEDVSPLPTPAEQPPTEEPLPVTGKIDVAVSDEQVATTSDQVASQSTDDVVVAGVDTKESEAEVKQVEAVPEAPKSSEVAVEAVKDKSEESTVISSTEDVDTPASPDQPKNGGVSAGGDVASPQEVTADSQEAEVASPATAPAAATATPAATPAAECEEMDCKDDEPDSTPQTTSTTITTPADQPTPSAGLPAEPSEAVASSDAPEPMEED